MKYVLMGQSAVPEPDLLKWAEWFQTANRVVKRTEVPGGLISTVFLGVDHNFQGGGPPILFETMTLADGESAGYKLCSTWSEAEKQHDEAVTLWLSKWAKR